MNRLVKTSSNLTRTVRNSAVVLLSAWCLSANAQQSDTVKVYYHYNSHLLELGFNHNAERIDKFINWLENMSPQEAATISGITIKSGASLEGETEKNTFLARMRGQKIAAYLNMRYPDFRFRTQLEEVNESERWKGLWQQIEQSNQPWKYDLLNILFEEQESPTKARSISEVGIEKMHQLHGGQVWDWMEKNLFMDMRASLIIVNRIVPGKGKKKKAEPEVTIHIQEIEEEAPAGVQPVTAMPVEPQRLSAAEKRQAEPEAKTTKRKYSGQTVASTTDYKYALKTNALYDMLMIPNLGFEMALPGSYSVGIDGGYGWWGSEMSYPVRSYSVELQGRKYFGSQWKKALMTGHHAGVYLQIGGFRFDDKSTVRETDGLCYGGGASYGYKLGINRRLFIDLAVYVGYLHGEYFKETYSNKKVVREPNKTLNWVGPTKAEISLNWFL